MLTLKLLTLKRKVTESGQWIHWFIFYNTFYCPTLDGYQKLAIITTNSTKTLFSLPLTADFSYS